MKRIVVCDSGLGGLNTAAGFFRKTSGDEAEILYCNVYPSPQIGYNTLKSDREREEMFRCALDGISRLRPDRCIIACNTLSIVWERIADRCPLPFPVTSIVPAAEDLIATRMLAEPESDVIILGTRSTVDSGVYQNRVISRGIAPDRVFAIACPGLATALETDLASPEIRERIAGYAEEAKGLLKNSKTRKLFLAFCCTHFSYVSALWKELFASAAGREIALLDPAGGFCQGIRGVRFQYHARIPFFGRAKNNFRNFFASSAPAVAQGLADAEPDEQFFQIPKGIIG